MASWFTRETRCKWQVPVLPVRYWRTVQAFFLTFMLNGNLTKKSLTAPKECVIENGWKNIQLFPFSACPAIILSDVLAFYKVVQRAYAATFDLLKLMNYTMQVVVCNILQLYDKL